MHEVSDVLREDDGERRDRPGRDHEEVGPPVQEADEAPVRLAEPHVHPACARHRRPQLRERERAREGERPAQRPREENARRRRERRGHLRGGAEDPRPDGRARRDQDEVEPREALREVGHAAHPTRGCAR